MLARSVARFAVLSAATAALVTLVATAFAAPEAGTPAPAFKLQDQKGAWHSLSDYRGKKVFPVTWASW